MLFMFEHDFYNHKGDHLAHCEMQGGWIDLKLRKLTSLPEAMLELAHKFPKSENFKVLTKADTRKHGVRPKPMQV
jgi:acyl-CoA thioester hydrolase